MAKNKCEGVPSISRRPEASGSQLNRVSRCRNDLFFVLLVLVQFIQNSWAAAANVMVQSELSDGQFSRWISMDSLRFKETSLTPESGKSPITLWQFTNKNSFFQIIFNDGYSKMIDCERVRKKDMIHSQIRKFDRELKILLHTNQTGAVDLRRNKLQHEYKMTPVSEHEFNRFVVADELPESFSSAFETMDEFNDIDSINQRDSLHFVNSVSVQTVSRREDLPDEIKPLLDMRPIIQRCEEFHKQMKEIVHGLESPQEDRRQNATETLHRRKRAIKDIFLAPNTRWCGRGHDADTYSQLGGASRADKCCRKHDHCKMNIHALSGKYRLFNYRPYTVSHCNCDRRKRRDLSSMFILPGTKYCGKGSLAKRYVEMGGRSKADRCCRQHDRHCPFWIEGFQTKYNLFNWRINTLMHCKCDERFRTCLKMADSSDASLVGNLFFNVVKTKCFVLKPEKYCKQYNFMKRKCERKGIRKRAYLRDNREF